MTISFKKGDMFSEPVEAIVNTVNCVGVMGKGVALEFKKRWSENFKAYKKLCDAKELSPGQMFIFDTNELFAPEGPRFLVNFPTKAHWRSKSKLSYIADGLDALARDIETNNIKSIAIPPLGCGNGGLDWSEVKPLIETKLGNLDGVDIIVFQPKDAVDRPEHINAELIMTYERAILLKALVDLERYFDGCFDRISLQKIGYFLQELGINFNLKFSRNLYGPYSDALKKAYIAFEQHGMIKGFTQGDRLTHVTPSGCAAADDFLGNAYQSHNNIVDKLSKLVQGYESPYGLELLSSVHWLVHHEKHDAVENIINGIRGWSEDKRSSFNDKAIRLAHARLTEDNLLQI